MPCRFASFYIRNKCTKYPSDALERTYKRFLIVALKTKYNRKENEKENPKCFFITIFYFEILQDEISNVYFFYQNIVDIFEKDRNLEENF